MKLELHFSRNRNQSPKDLRVHLEPSSTTDRQYSLHLNSLSLPSQGFSQRCLSLLYYLLVGLILYQIPKSPLYLLILSLWNTMRPSCQMCFANWSVVLAWFIHSQFECTVNTSLPNSGLPWQTFTKAVRFKYQKEKPCYPLCFLYLSHALGFFYSFYFIGASTACVKACPPDIYLTWLFDIEVIRNATGWQGYIKRTPPFPFYFCFAFLESHMTLADLEFFYIAQKDDLELFCTPTKPQLSARIIAITSLGFMQGFRYKPGLWIYRQAF